MTRPRLIEAISWTLYDGHSFERSNTVLIADIADRQSLIKGLVVTHYYTNGHTTKVKICDLGEAYSTMTMSKEQLSENGNLCIFYGELFTIYGCIVDKVKSRINLEKGSATLSSGRDLLFPASTTVDAWKSHTNLTHPGKYFRPSKVKIMRPTSPK